MIIISNNNNNTDFFYLHEKTVHKTKIIKKSSSTMCNFKHTYCNSLLKYDYTIEKPACQCC